MTEVNSIEENGRRIFYVDVGNLSKEEVKAFIKEAIDRFNKRD